MDRFRAGVEKLKNIQVVSAPMMSLDVDDQLKLPKRLEGMEWDSELKARFDSFVRRRSLQDLESLEVPDEEREENPGPAAQSTLARLASSALDVEGYHDPLSGRSSVGSHTSPSHRFTPRLSRLSRLSRFSCQSSSRGTRRSRATSMSCPGSPHDFSPDVSPTRGSGGLQCSELSPQKTEEQERESSGTTTLKRAAVSSGSSTARPRELCTGCNLERTLGGLVACGSCKDTVACGHCSLCPNCTTENPGTSDESNEESQHPNLDGAFAVAQRLVDAPKQKESDTVQSLFDQSRALLGDELPITAPVEGAGRSLLDPDRNSIFDNNTSSRSGLFDEGAVWGLIGLSFEGSNRCLYGYGFGNDWDAGARLEANEGKGIFGLFHGRRDSTYLERKRKYDEFQDSRNKAAYILQLVWRAYRKRMQFRLQVVTRPPKKEPCIQLQPQVILESGETEPSPLGDPPSTPEPVPEPLRPRPHSVPVQALHSWGGMREDSPEQALLQRYQKTQQPSPEREARQFYSFRDGLSTPVVMATRSEPNTPFEHYRSRRPSLDPRLQENRSTPSPSSAPSPSSVPPAEKQPGKALSTFACRKSPNGSERPAKSSFRGVDKQEAEISHYVIAMPTALTSVTHQGSLQTTQGLHRGSRFSLRNRSEAKRSSIQSASEVYTRPPKPQQHRSKSPTKRDRVVYAKYNWQQKQQSSNPLTTMSPHSLNKGRHIRSYSDDYNRESSLKLPQLVGV